MWGDCWEDKGSGWRSYFFFREEEDHIFLSLEEKEYTGENDCRSSCKVSSVFKLEGQVNCLAWEGNKGGALDSVKRCHVIACILWARHYAYH